MVTREALELASSKESNIIIRRKKLIEYISYHLPGLNEEGVKAYPFRATANDLEIMSEIYNFNISIYSEILTYINFKARNIDFELFSKEFPYFQGIEPDYVL